MAQASSFPQAGEVTLSNGAATVTGVFIVASSMVWLQLAAPSGSVSAHYYVPASSMVLSTSSSQGQFSISGSSGDNSTLNWLVLDTLA